MDPTHHFVNVAINFLHEKPMFFVSFFPNDHWFLLDDKNVPVKKRSYQTPCVSLYDWLVLQAKKVRLVAHVPFLSAILNWGPI